MKTPFYKSVSIFALQFLLGSIALADDCSLLAIKSSEMGRFCCKVSGKIERTCELITDETCGSPERGTIHYCFLDKEILEGITKKYEQISKRVDSELSPKLACELREAPRVEVYSDRPDILSLDSKKMNVMAWVPGNEEHKEEYSPVWGTDSITAEKIRKGLLEAISEILEFYPDYEIYFLGRDGEILFDMARVLAEGTSDSARLHLLLGSRSILIRGSHYNPDYKQYLAEEGISEETFRAGKKVLFVDLGYSGTAYNIFGEMFPQFRSQMKAHFLASVRKEIPSTRVFLESVDRNTPEITPYHLVTELEGLPMYFNSGKEVRFINGRWRATSPVDREEVGSGDSFYPDKTLAVGRMRDIKFFATLPESREHFQKRRAQFKNLYLLWKLKKTTELDHAIRKIKSEEPELGNAIEQDLRQTMTQLFPGY